MNQTYWPGPMPEPHGAPLYRTCRPDIPSHWSKVNPSCGPRAMVSASLQLAPPPRRVPATGTLLERDTPGSTAAQPEKHVELERCG